LPTRSLGGLVGPQHHVVELTGIGIKGVNELPQGPGAYTGKLTFNTKNHSFE
jgi:hypothetical protein